MISIPNESSPCTRVGVVVHRFPTCPGVDQEYSVVMVDQLSKYAWYRSFPKDDSDAVHKWVMEKMDEFLSNNLKPVLVSCFTDYRYLLERVHAYDTIDFGHTPYAHSYYVAQRVLKHVDLFMKKWIKIHEITWNDKSMFQKGLEKAFDEYNDTIDPITRQPPCWLMYGEPPTWAVHEDVLPRFRNKDTLDSDRKEALDSIRSIALLYRFVVY